MSKNYHLAKSILDASFNRICEMLKWKTKIQGKYYYQVDTYYPSSKTCSVCGNKTEVTNNLNVRIWECENCGCLNDRDINASINIMFEGLRLHYQS
jgi:putative transposase